MKKFALMIAAATVLLTAPALVQSASAEDVNVRIGTSHDNGHHYGWRHRGYHSNAAVVVARPGCRTVTTRTKRANGSIVISKHRRCG